MQVINVELRRIKVASFSPSKEDVSFIINFSDGKDKEITKTLKTVKGDEAALEVIKDIRGVETRLNAEFDGKAVLDSYINIIIKDEDKVNEKLAAFFSKVFEKVKVIRNQKSADGYMALINSVNSMRLDF
jgi:hypothetical protein